MPGRRARTGRGRASSGRSGRGAGTRWKSRYAAGARLIAVPGWPLPTFWTASMASARTVSTARWSRSVQSSFEVLTGQGSFDVACSAGRAWQELRARAYSREIGPIRRPARPRERAVGRSIQWADLPLGRTAKRPSRRDDPRSRVTAVDSRRGGQVPAARSTSDGVAVGRPRRTAGQTASAYVALTKPRIIELLLVTTVPTMFLAAGRRPVAVAGRRHAGRRRRSPRAARTPSTATSTATSTR